MTQNSNPELQDDIKAVAWNASKQMQASGQRSFVQRHVPTALTLLLIVPIAALLAQAGRWLAGFGAGTLLSLPLWIALTVLMPAVWLGLKVVMFRVSIDRRKALLAADEQLGSSERITTADDFMDRDQTDGFMQAAVDDAAHWAKQGRDTRLESNLPGIPKLRRALLSVPVSIAMLSLVVFLAQFHRPSRGTPQVAERPQAISMAPTAVTPTRNDKPEVQTPEPESPNERKESPRDPRKQRAVNRQGAANAAIPENAEESQGKLNQGETRESQQSSNPSSARGAPSASGQPSKSDDETKPRKKKKQVKKPDQDRKKKQRKQEEKPSGATAGQGSSKGSDNNAAPSDWASTSQAATPEDENLEDEDEVDDEEEEQESRGGVQPNMRDRRTPVNRDLQIGFGSNRPNPDANGRGGPGGQKKSRGVASLVLGVPIPDRVNGQPNKGRIRITQQRITPEPEQSDPVPAQQRAVRNGPVGPIHHPDLSPWLQNLIRRYFLEQREQNPLTNSGGEAEANSSQDSLQTLIVAESDSPQS